MKWATTKINFQPKSSNLKISDISSTIRLWFRLKVKRTFRASRNWAIISKPWTFWANSTKCHNTEKPTRPTNWLQIKSKRKICIRHRSRWNRNTARSIFLKRSFQIGKVQVIRRNFMKTRLGLIINRDRHFMIAHMGKTSCRTFRTTS